MLKNKLTKQEIENNREEIISLLRSTKRDGVENLISVLDRYGFFTEQPLGYTHHHEWIGGLAQHSLGVFKIAEAIQFGLDRDSLIIACLLHDLCKLHLMLKAYPEIEQRYPRGHGRRSLALAQKTGITLMEDEGKAIANHMHRDEASVHSLQAIVHRADKEDARNPEWYKTIERKPYEGIMAGSDCMYAATIEQKYNGKLVIHCTTKVLGMGVGEYNNTLMDKEYDEVVPFDGGEYAYAAVKDATGWSLLRFETLSYAVSVASDHPYASFEQLLAAHGMQKWPEGEGALSTSLRYTRDRVVPDFTPERIVYLREECVFVFGSNLAGQHHGGAARVAHEKFGAIWGEGVGLHGQSYAIPTMHGGVEAIRPYVEDFLAFACKHPELYFFVTRIGCGIAGFRDEEIAPLFMDAIGMNNVILPETFIKALQ